MTDDELISKYYELQKKIKISSYQKYIEYGLEDVRLLSDIDAETKYIELVIMLGYKSKTNWEDSFFQVRMWDCTFYDFLKNNKNIQVPFLKYDFNEELDDNPEDGYEGAYVKAPVAGKYKWIVSDDVQSLYPSIMMAWNMSPETYAGLDKYDVKYLVENLDGKLTQKLKDDNIALAANGSKYIRDFKGFVPEVLQAEFDARVFAKNTAKEAKKGIEAIENILKERGVPV